MKMKELEARTGVGREAIRYYIREGLLDEPQRPKRNVAVYSDAHVERIALIKRLQQERFLPLAKIKDVLDDGAGELESEQLPSLLGLEFLLSARFSDEHSRQPVPLSEVADGTTVTLKDIEELDGAGMVSIAKGGTLTRQDAEIVSLWGRLKDAGFSPDRGYEPASMARFVEVAESIAAEDVASFFENLPADIDAGTATSMAEQGIILSNDILGRLRLRAIIRELAERNARFVERKSAVSEKAKPSADGDLEKQRKV